jgi:hypothetical protein
VLGTPKQKNTPMGKSTQQVLLLKFTIIIFLQMTTLNQFIELQKKLKIYLRMIIKFSVGIVMMRKIEVAILASHIIMTRKHQIS